MGSCKIRMLDVVEEGHTLVAEYPECDAVDFFRLNSNEKLLRWIIIWVILRRICYSIIPSISIPYAVYRIL